MLGNFTESLKGTVGGVALLIASFPILFKNEGCAVDIAKGLEEGAALVQSIDAKQSLTNYNSKLIHASGEAKAGAKISDSSLGVEVSALALVRGVEMYQWEEKVTEKEEGSKKSKEYSYDADWSSTKVDSSKFEYKKDHTNPPFPYKDETFRPSSVSLGNLQFSQSLIESITSYSEFTYDAATIARIKAKLGAKTQIHDGGIYIGKNPLSPEIGDVRIKHQIAPEGTASIIGLLNGDTVNPYQTKRDTTILVFDYGTKDAATMFKEEQDANVFRTWAVRIIGFFAMFLGFRLLFGPIAAAGGWIPILGGILEMGVSIVAGILAFSFSFVTIAIAWIFFRPILGIGLLLLGGGAFAYLLYQKGKFGNKPPEAAKT
ncbi:TMEM43 family protein [Leptospira sp. 'Mane']|uniref:TMEM43 family protein n=1 Tax=Leptospira sp. 'Mane' TaxID=3387407 RepID=UPI00398AE4C4